MKEDPKNYLFKYYVRISGIDKHFDKDGVNDYYYFTYEETNSANITHTKFYHSTNYITLQRKREELIIATQNRKNELNRSGYYEGIALKPTIFDQIRANQMEKIK